MRNKQSCSAPLKKQKKDSNQRSKTAENHQIHGPKPQHSSPGGLPSNEIYPRIEKISRAVSHISFANMVGPYYYFLAYLEILNQTAGTSHAAVACLIPFIISCLTTPSDNMLNSIKVFMSVFPESSERGIKLSWQKLLYDEVSLSRGLSALTMLFVYVCVHKNASEYVLLSFCGDV